MNKIKQFLININSIPFPLTVKHYFPFDKNTSELMGGELSSAHSWDVLRESHPHFSISENREEWVRVNESLIKKDGQDGALKKRATEVVSLFREIGIKSIFSAGVGGAGLEYHIKKNMPEVRMTCSEYSKVAVERLKKVFLECDSVIWFDMKNSNWSLANQGVDPQTNIVLLYRIDIDLNDSELDSIFKNMYQAEIQNVLIILCGRLTLRGLLNRLFKRLQWILDGTQFAFSGFLRTEKRFVDFWWKLYDYKEVNCGGLKGYILHRKAVV